MKMKIPCTRDYPEGLLRAPVGVSLSDDLITEILLRLPVRSLLRFKCVCKSWFSIISDSQFAKLHFDLTLAPTDLLLVKFPADTKATSIEIDAPIHSDSKDVVSTFPCYAPYSLVGYKDLTVMGSCRGFILLTSSFFTASNLTLFVIWNPSTGQVKRCTRELLACDFVCGIGYDSSTDDYLIIVVTFYNIHSCQMKVHCFSVSNGSWSYIEDTTVPIFPQSIQDWRGFKLEASFLNDTFHWLLSTSHHGKILTFDVKERKLSEISLPRDVRVHGKLYRLTVMGEYLCVYLNRFHPKSEVWTMKEYKVQSSWTKSSNIPTPASSRSSDFSPVCCTKNGEIFGLGSFGRLMRLNDKGELFEFRVVKQYDYKLIFLRPQGMIYRESLLSLP